MPPDSVAVGQPNAHEPAAPQPAGSTRYTRTRRRSIDEVDLHRALTDHRRRSPPASRFFSNVTGRTRADDFGSGRRTGIATCANRCGSPTAVRCLRAAGLTALPRASAPRSGSHGIDRTVNSRSGDAAVDRCAALGARRRPTACTHRRRRTRLFRVLMWIGVRWWGRGSWWICRRMPLIGGGFGCRGMWRRRMWRGWVWLGRSMRCWVRWWPLRMVRRWC